MNLLINKPVVFDHPTINQTWLTKSLRPYGLSAGQRFQQVEYTALSHYITVDKTLPWVEVDLNKYTTRFHISGYSYNIPTLDLTQEFGGANKSLYLINLSGVAHGYSRRSRRDTVFLLPRADDADFIFWVSKYLRVTWYSDYGGVNETFAIRGSNNRFFFVLEDHFDCWSNRINWDQIFRTHSGNRENEFYMLNPELFRMSRATVSSVPVMDGQRPIPLRPVHEDCPYAMITSFDYSLPWTS